MNKEEIIERIKVCEKCESDYLKTKTFDRAKAFYVEKLKWGKLLSELKKADIYKQTLNEIRDKLLCYGETFDSDIHKQFQKECLEIIDKVGDD